MFYVFGAIGLLWFVFWMLLISDSPAKCEQQLQLQQ